MELLTKNKLLTAVLAVLSVAGIGAYIFQLAGGLAVTGMSNGVSWGLYITMFMFFVGLSAGGLIVASSASVFHIKRFKAVAMPAIILSTVCICLAGMFVLIDLGGIQRVWRIVTGPNPTSPLVWDICVITLYLVINVLYLVNMQPRQRPRGVHHLAFRPALRHSGALGDRLDLRPADRQGGLVLGHHGAHLRGLGHGLGPGAAAVRAGRA